MDNEIRSERIITLVWQLAAAIWAFNSQTTAGYVVAGLALICAVITFSLLLEERN